MKQASLAELQANQEILQQQRNEANQECALGLQMIIEEEFEKIEGVHKYTNQDIAHFVVNWNKNRKQEKYPQPANSAQVIEILKTAGIEGVDSSQFEIGIIQQKTREGIKRKF